MIGMWHFGQGDLPRSEAYYWFVATGIVVSWVVMYIAVIVVLHLFVPEKDEAPRSFYIIAMLGGLIGPSIFLWRLWVRNNRAQLGVRADIESKPS